MQLYGERADILRGVSKNGEMQDMWVLCRKPKKWYML